MKTAHNPNYSKKKQQKYQSDLMEFKLHLRYSESFNQFIYFVITTHNIHVTNSVLS